MSTARRLTFRSSFLGRLLGLTNANARQSTSDRVLVAIMLAMFIGLTVAECHHPCPDCPMTYDIDLGPDR